MNWFKKLSQNSTEELLLLKRQGEEGISYIDFLSKIFPTANFQTTLRQEDLVRQFGPQIVFRILHKNMNIPEFKKYSNITTSTKIKIRGFVQSSGFDNKLYVLDGDNFVPYENIPEDNWFYFQDIMTNKTSPMFESGKNLIMLIHYNVLRNLDSHFAWEKYKNQPQIKNILEQINEYDLAVKDGEEMLLQNIPPEDQDAFKQKYKEWWWSRKPKEDFIQSIEKSLQEVYKEKEQTQNAKSPKDDPYEYNISMNPHKEGKGKFIDVELIEQALELYPDFNIMVRFNAGREQYKASDIARFKNAEPNDDEAYYFYNHGNGIRDMFIV